MPFRHFSTDEMYENEKRKTQEHNPETFRFSRIAQKIFSTLAAAYFTVFSAVKHFVKFSAIIIGSCHQRKAHISKPYSLARTHSPTA